MEPVALARDPGLDALRRRRAELFAAMTALEHALAAPAPRRVAAWTERVDAALVELSADLREHVASTEGPDGLHGAVLATAPRLAHRVKRLVRDHAELTDLVAGLASRVSRPIPDGDVADIRDRGRALLARLARHRQHGADLVYQAYQVDVGGET